MSHSTEISAEMIPRAKNKHARIAALGVACVIIAVGAALIQYSKTHIGTDIAYVGAQIVEIKSPSDGFLRAEHLQDNHIFQKGDSIFLIDADTLDYEAIRKLEIQLENNKFVLREMETALSLAEMDVKKTKAILDYTQQHVDYANIEYQRQLHLQHKGLNGASLMGLATLKYQEATSNLITAKLTNETAVLQVSQQQQRIKMATLQLNKAILEIEIAKKRLLRNQIISQNNIIVAKTLRVNGDWISQGDIVFYGYDNENTWVDAYIDERHINQITPGMTARVEFDSINNATYEGTISSVSSVGGGVLAPLSPNYSSGHVLRVTQRYVAKIPINTLRCVQCPPSISNQPPVVKPGMSAHAHIQIP